MNTRVTRFAAVLAAFAGNLLLSPRSSGADTPDFKSVADRVVVQSAGVKEGDRVVLRGDVRDLALLEEMSLAVEKRGGEAIQIITREAMGRRYFDEVPARYDRRPRSLALKLAEFQTVEIVVGGTEHPELLKGVAPERVVAVQAREADVLKAQLRRRVRLVALGNGLYPTEAIARRYGVTKDQLATLFWSGVNVDYGRLQAISSSVRAGLAAGTQVRITHANGTDFTCRILNRKVAVSDGVISAEDVAKGPPATQVWLPAGEVYAVPVAGSAEGRIVFDTLPFREGELLNATFTFKGGKLTAHSAQPGDAYEQWKAEYAAAPSRRDEFAFIDIGTNPNVQVPPGSKLATWVPAGSVSIGLGENAWAGGENNCGWSFSGSLNGCTLTVDGKTLVERGELRTGERVASVSVRSVD